MVLGLRKPVLLQLLNLKEPIHLQYVKSINMTVSLTLNTFVVLSPTSRVLFVFFTTFLSKIFPDGDSSVALMAEFNFMLHYNKGTLNNWLTDQPVH